MQNVYSLSQIAAIIKEIFSISFNDFFWVRAEISEIHENKNGHCYLELIEKDKLSDRIVARFKAIIWSSTYRFLKPYFEQHTQTTLKAGINIQVKVQLEYNELYGISLIILDIDPTYTVGDFELKRAQVIQKLIADGVFEMNKLLEMPLVPQRIAVISSETAAGFQDFVNHLENNEYHFRYEIKLFKALMQGDEAEASIIEALDKINYEQFDVVVITRGGGSRSDLSCFDSYLLALHICQYPLPVISAIGHERDVSVVDMVAHTREKTPTAAAHFIISKTLEFWNLIENINQNILHRTELFVEQQGVKLQHLIQKIFYIKEKHNEYEYFFYELFRDYHTLLNSFINNKLLELNNNFNVIKINYTKAFQKNAALLQIKQNELLNKTQQNINNKIQHIINAEKLIAKQDPSHILKKGFSITKKNGKTIKKSTEVNSGDELITTFYNGQVTSYVK
ncbi:MAG: exodeoxyribonuclease VII large subunit [Bacteroidales bacterium]|nr:exodeoxyribonuclease VII large subunit [Bacteroidales bacterium]